MDELVKLVSKKTGIPEQTARVAVDTVLNFIKQKLPAPLAAQIDALVKGGVQGDDMLKGLGDLLGK